MAEGGVLHPPADLIQGAVGDPHDMEQIGDAHRMFQPPYEACPVRLIQIGGATMPEAPGTCSTATDYAPLATLGSGGPLTMPEVPHMGALLA